MGQEKLKEIFAMNLCHIIFRSNEGQKKASEFIAFIKNEIQTGAVTQQHIQYHFVKINNGSFLLKIKIVQGYKN